jgi:hypothetical protein
MVADMVVSIIREVGIERLCEFDGCLCSHFSLRNVDVHISCYKNSGLPLVDNPKYPDEGVSIGQVLVRVRCIDLEMEDLAAIGEEVKSQLSAMHDYPVVVQLSSERERKLAT